MSFWARSWCGKKVWRRNMWLNWKWIESSPQLVPFFPSDIIIIMFISSISLQHCPFILISIFFRFFFLSVSFFHWISDNNLQCDLPHSLTHSFLFSSIHWVIEVARKQDKKIYLDEVNGRLPRMENEWGKQWKKYSMNGRKKSHE